MDNGDTFLAFIEESIEILRDKEVKTYYPEPLPSATDEAMDKIIGRFMAATSDQRERFQSRLSPEQRSLFSIYGHRAATLGVRRESKAQLLRGLVGVVIANYTIPENRRVEVGLAVFHHCARKLGKNTVDLFDEAAEFATTDFAGTLRKFGRRSDVTLRKFGWRELNTSEGVKYTFSYG